MKPAALALSLSGRLVVLAAVLAASTAFAQPGAPGAGVAGPVPVAPGTTAANVAPAPGLPGPQSVDPAPGAAGPYANHSEHAFYDVDARISRYQQRAGGLPGAQKKQALSEIASIKQEETAQIARHGDLLDWARENLNNRLDKLKAAYPSLAG